MANELTTANYATGLVLTEEDVNYSETSALDNSGVVFQSLTGNVGQSDYVLKGLEVRQTGTPSMSIEIVSGSAYDVDIDKFIQMNTNIITSLLSNGGAEDRIDVVQIIQEVTEFSIQARDFKDAAGVVTTDPAWPTKKRYAIKVEIVEGVENISPVAPDTTIGRIKIAEIYIQAGLVAGITNNMIREIESQEDGIDNSTWSNEKDRTYRLGTVNNLKETVYGHSDKDGNLKDNVVTESSLNNGTGTNQINGASIESGVTQVLSSGGGFSGDYDYLPNDTINVILNRLIEQVRQNSNVGSIEMWDSDTDGYLDLLFSDLNLRKLRLNGQRISRLDVKYNELIRIRSVNYGVNNTTKNEGRYNDKSAWCFVNDNNLPDMNGNWFILPNYSGVKIHHSVPTQPDYIMPVSAGLTFVFTDGPSSFNGKRVIGNVGTHYHSISSGTGNFSSGNNAGSSSSNDSIANNYAAGVRVSMVVNY